MRMESERALIAEYGRKMSTAGLSHGTAGNISIYDKQTGLMAITPSGVNYFDITPEDIVIAREKLNAVKAGVDTLLSDLEKEVLFLYLDGNDYKQISQKLGTTAKAVDNALQRVRRKLKNV